MAAPLTFYLARYLKTPFAWLAWVAIWIVAWRMVLGYRAERHRKQLDLNASAAGILEHEFYFVLYLRPFMTAGRLLAENAMPSRADRFLLGSHWDLELALSLALEGRGRLLAIGGGEDSEGAAKLQVDDARWRELLADCAARAFAIVMVPLPRPSTLWEVRYLFEHPDLLEKAMFLMPPDEGAWWRKLLRPRAESPRALWELAARELAPQGINLPPYRSQGGWLRFNAERRLVLDASLFGVEPETTWAILATAGMYAIGKRDEAVAAFEEMQANSGAFERERRAATREYQVKWALWGATVLAIFWFALG